MLLSLSYRQSLRLKEKVETGGLEAILRPSRVAPNKLKDTSKYTFTLIKEPKYESVQLS